MGTPHTATDEAAHLTHNAWIGPTSSRRGVQPAKQPIAGRRDESDKWSRGESNPRPETREPYKASDYGSSSARGGAESDAFGADRRRRGLTDGDLARLIDAWQSLPESTKTEIVAMLDLAQGKARK